MSAPRVDQLSDGPLDGLAETVSEQALVLARQQVEMARRGMAMKAKEAAPGAAMLGGAAVLSVLASGTGTAALVLLLARRREAPAALAVTGAYAGAGVLLAREGLARLRDAGSLASEEAVQEAMPEDEAQKAKPEEAVRNVKKTVGSAKQGGKSAVKSAGRATSRARPAKSRSGTSSRQSKRPPQRASRRTT